LSSTEPVSRLHLSNILQKQYIADFSQAVDDFNAYQIPNFNSSFTIVTSGMDAAVLLCYMDVASAKQKIFAYF